MTFVYLQVSYKDGSTSLRVSPYHHSSSAVGLHVKKLACKCPQHAP